MEISGRREKRGHRGASAAGAVSAGSSPPLSCSTGCRRVVRDCTARCTTLRCATQYRQVYVWCLGCESDCVVYSRVSRSPQHVSVVAEPGVATQWLVRCFTLCRVGFGSYLRKHDPCWLVGLWGGPHTKETSKAYGQRQVPWPSRPWDVQRGISRISAISRHI